MIGLAQSVRPIEQPRLTRRQTEVLRLVAEGLSNQEIAGKLWLSVETVRRHMSGLLHALQVNNRTKAAAWAWRNGLMDDDREAAA